MFQLIDVSSIETPLMPTADNIRGVGMVKHYKYTLVLANYIIILNRILL
jgi:hypothetical protein